MGMIVDLEILPIKCSCHTRSLARAMLHSLNTNVCLAGTLFCISCAVS